MNWGEAKPTAVYFLNLYKPTKEISKGALWAIWSTKKLGMLWEKTLLMAHQIFKNSYFGVLMASSPLNEANFQTGIETCQYMTLSNLLMRRRERKLIKATTSLGQDKSSLDSVGQIAFILCIIVQTNAQAYNDLRKLCLIDEQRSKVVVSLLLV